MKKKLFWACLFVSAALCLCACGADSADMESSNQMPSSASLNTEPQENGPLDEIFTPQKAKPGIYQTISTNGSSYFAVKNDNTLWGWGSNKQGQLGIGTNSEQQTEPVLIMEDVKAVNAKGSQTVILKTDGTAWACGRGLSGDGSMESGVHSTPTHIMDDVISVYTASVNCYVIKSDHSLWAWGGDGKMIGNGSTEPQPSPVKVMDDVASLSGSSSTILAVKTDGTLWSWGIGYINGANEEKSNIPVQIMDNVLSAYIGHGRACFGVVKSDGTLWVWGIGVGTDISSPLYVMDNVAAVSVQKNGGFCVIKNDGSFWEWNVLVSYTPNPESAIYYYTNDKQWKRWDGIENPENLMDDFVAIDGDIWGPAVVVRSDGTLWDYESGYKVMDDIKLS